MSDHNQVPEQFEEAVKRAAVEHYGYGRSDALLKTLLDRNRNGRFAVDWVNGFLFARQASRQAVVVELPNRPYASEEDQEQMTDYEMGLGHGGCELWDKIKGAIEAQGLRCEVKS